MPLFRRLPGGRYALPIAMAAVRMGERVLIMGCGDPKMLAAVATRAGLTGMIAAVVTSESDKDRLSAAAAGAGLLVEVAVAPGWSGFPHCDQPFDVAVIDGTRGWFGAMPPADRLACLSGVFGALRHGGRALVIERRLSAPKAWLRPARPSAPDYVSAGGAAGGLEAAGFRPVRVLAEQGGWRFVEGLRG